MYNSILDAVIDIMKDNVHQVINRNEKLDETENLAASLGTLISRKTVDPPKNSTDRKVHY